MARVYELPTHLQVEDTLVAGLSARQLLRLAVGAALAYGLWDQAPWLPLGVRLGLATLCALAGGLLALVHPGQRPLDAWLLAGLRYLLSPRHLAWRPADTLPQLIARDGPDGADLELAPAWTLDAGARPADWHPTLVVG